MQDACMSITHRAASHGQAERQPDPITVSIAEAIRLSGLGRTRLYELAANGSVERRYEGAKLLLVYASLRDYLLALPEDRAS